MAFLNKRTFTPQILVDGDEMPVAVALQMVSTNFLQSKETLLGGIPDGVAKNGFVYNPAAAGFNANLQSYATQLQALAVGWLNWAHVGPKIQITGYEVSASGFVTFGTAMGALLGIVYRGPQVVRISGLNGGKSTLNGEILVQVVDNQTFVSVKPIAALAFTGPGKVLFYTQPLPFVAAAQIGNPSCAEHKRGNRSWQSPGRRRARVRV